MPNACLTSQNTREKIKTMKEVVFSSEDASLLDMCSLAQSSSASSLSRAAMPAIPRCRGPMIKSPNPNNATRSVCKRREIHEHCWKGDGTSVYWSIYFRGISRESYCFRLKLLGKKNQFLARCNFAGVSLWNFGWFLNSRGMPGELNGIGAWLGFV